MARGFSVVLPQTTRDALQGCTIPVLQSMAKLAGLPRLQRKTDLVATMARYFDRDENLTAEIARMEQVERQALAEAAHDAHGQVDWRRFAAKYGVTPPRTPTSRLALFFFPTERLPSDLQDRLRHLLPEPPAAELAGLGELPPTPADADPLTVRATARPAQADLSSVLQLIDAGKLRCSEKTRRPTAATMSLVAEALAAGDFYEDPVGAIGPIAAFAWPLLVQAGGLAELAGGRLQLTSRGRAALASPPHQTLRQLWPRWVKHGLLDEFSRVEAIKGQRAKGGRALSAVGPRRAVVDEALGLCPPERWVAVDDLFRFMEAEELDPEVARNLWHLYIVDPQYGNLAYDGSHDWALLQGRYVLAVLFEYAATLGLCDVAYEDPEGARDDYGDLWGTDELPYLSRYDGLRYIRLNALGAYVLGAAGTYVQPPEVSAARSGLIRVLPNLDVVVVARRLPVADGAFLEAWAERTGDATWHLRRRRMLAAAEAGRDIGTLAEFLRERGQGELPDTVATLVEDVAERAGRLRDAGPARLIECSDAGMAQLLTGDPKLRDLCLPCGERHVVVPLQAEAAFRKRLRTLGYVLPQVPATTPAAKSRAISPSP